MIPPFARGPGPVAVLIALLGAGLGAQSAAKSTRPRAEVDPPPPVVSRATRHLTFTATLSHSVIAPGGRMSIVVDVVPKKGMHVYAPGSQYRAVAISLARQPGLRLHETVYPQAARYTFKPLNEEVLVYAEPFRLVREVTAVDTADHRARVAPTARVPIRAQLDYQACDDRVCYLPTSVAFDWTVRVTR